MTELAWPDGTERRPYSLEEAYAWCNAVVADHPEHYPVASKRMAEPLRRHASAVYAFSRVANAFADHPDYAGRRPVCLDTWQELLERTYHGRAEHPAFVALEAAVRQFNIPITPFQDLLAGFRMDLHKHRYTTWGELLNYCSLSGVPVGRLLLWLGGEQRTELQALADPLAIGLRLTDILLDVGADARAGRFYVPEEDLLLFEVTTEDLAAGVRSEGLEELVTFQVARARMWFRRARPLLRKLGPGLSDEVGEIWRSGMQTLQRLESGEADVLAVRDAV
ncbi:phytoene/squalene synthase family protein [Paraliomyxa miuraensis]|uniref:phytoene/squalene synthase family protein n=1 Tax=Paraliomyxa miuraensis TaxID=376150 RepID=UPI00224F95BE|nr:squalene/phytoene synthase family protein [Paraliomyxa miuraensis]MCX4246180.1 squalene/phytoene synthase family protein [Paraliomyxa miuraensis]